MSKCTELEWERISDDLIELSDTEQTYIHSGDETDSDDAGNNSAEKLVL